MIFGRLYTRSLGVHVGRDHVRAVELVRIGGWVRQSRSWCLPARDRLADALADLGRIVGRRVVRVATHVEPALVRSEVRAATVDEVQDAGFVRRVAASLLPHGVSHDHFAVAHRVLRVEEDRVFLAVSVCPRRARDARLEAFREAGLDLAFVGVSALETAAAAASDPEFGDQCRRLVVEEGGQCHVVAMRDGLVESLARLAPGDFEKLLGDRSATPGSIWLAPSGPIAVDAGQITLVRPLRGLRGGRLHDPTFAIATGLALRGLCLHSAGREGDGSFLEPAEAARLQRRHEERTGKRLAVALGAVVLATLLALTAAEDHAGRQLARAEAALAPVARMLTVLDEHRERTARLRSEVSIAEERLRTRTRTAEILSIAAFRSPIGLRWQHLELRLHDDGDTRLIIAGLARPDSSLAVFLRDLESADFTSEVRLVVAETMAFGRDIAHDTPRGPDLRRYEVHAVVPGAMARAASTRRNDTGT